MIQGTIHQKDITIVNIYAPNMGVNKYGKQILTDLKAVKIQQHNSGRVKCPTFNKRKFILKEILDFRPKEPTRHI